MPKGRVVADKVQFQRTDRRHNDLTAHLTRASGISMGVRVAGLALALLSHLALSRALGANQYGQYVIALGWAMVLVIPSRLGLDNSVLRFATIYREEERAGDLRGLVFFSLGCISLIALVIVGALLASKLLGVEPLRPIGWMLLGGVAMLVPALAIMGWLSALIRTANRIFASQFYEQVLRPALLIGAVVLAVMAGLEINAGQAMLVTGAIVMAATLGIAVHALTVFRGLASGRSSFKHRSEWLSLSWPLFLMAVVQELLNQADLILLGLLSNATQAAHFAAAARLAGLVTFGLMAIGTVSGPLVASAYNRRDMSELGRIATLGARFSSIFAVAIATLLALLGKPALGLFGPGFADAYPVLLILLIGGLANSFTGAVGYLLIMTGSEKAALRVMAAALFVSLLANLVLIPRLGAIGAAIASTLSLATWNFAMAAYLRRRLGIDATVFGRVMQSANSGTG